MSLPPHWLQPHQHRYHCYRAINNNNHKWTATRCVAVQSNEMRNSPKEIGVFNENGRNFVATKDTSRDFSNSQDNTDRGSMSDQAFACSASSVESLPSASGSSKFILHVSLCVSTTHAHPLRLPANQRLLQPTNGFCSLSIFRKSATATATT